MLSMVRALACRFFISFHIVIMHSSKTRNKILKCTHMYQGKKFAPPNRGTLATPMESILLYTVYMYMQKKVRCMYGIQDVTFIF